MSATAEVVAADLIQGSEAWLAWRCGKFNASELHPLVATRGDGAGRATLVRKVIAERISGIPQGFEGNEDTDFGHEQEPHARHAFCVQESVFLQRVGGVPHPVLPYAGASPDGIVPKEFGAEFKSHRKAVKFIEMVEGAIPRKHLIQCQFGMACTGLPRWAYCNWCPQMPEGKRLHTRWIERDEDLIAQLVVAVRAAELEVATRVAEYLLH